MTVSANVLAVAKKTVIHQTPVVNVTNEDLARGYVEVAKATVVEVKTNSRNGYLLSFENSGASFGEVWVIEGERVTVITGNGGFVNEANRSNGGYDRDERTRLQDISRARREDRFLRVASYDGGNSELSLVGFLFNFQAVAHGKYTSGLKP